MLKMYSLFRPIVKRQIRNDQEIFDRLKGVPLMSMEDEEREACMRHAIQEPMIFAKEHKFDCSSLPDAFLLETGEEYLLDLRNSKEPPRFPFEDFMVELCIGGKYYGVSISHDKEEYEAETMPFWAMTVYPYREDYIDFQDVQCDLDKDDDGSFGLAIHRFEGIEDEEPLREIADVAHAVLGVMALFEEKLLIQERRKAEGRTVTKKKNGKERLGLDSDYSILKLNLAETRRRTRGTPLRSHESPALHWRRGHWRTIGRLSEFERSVWVRKCLVGDPDRGFAKKVYKLEWRQTIH